VSTPLVTDYRALSDALELVLRRATFTDRAEAEAILVESAGTDPAGVVVYRPYVVLASLYETHWERYRSLTGASGASLEFADPEDARLGYLRQQGRLDESLELTVPSAWPASSAAVFASGW
jgi:hypothetical protein